MFMRLVTMVEWCVILSYMTSLVRLVGVEILEGWSKAQTSTRLWFGRRLPRCSPEDDELRNEYASGSIVVTLCGSGGVVLLISSLEHRPCALQWHLAASSDAPLLTHIGLAGTTSLVRRSTCD